MHALFPQLFSPSAVTEDTISVGVTTSSVSVTVTTTPVPIIMTTSSSSEASTYVCDYTACSMYVHTDILAFVCI